MSLMADTQTDTQTDTHTDTDTDTDTDTHTDTQAQKRRPGSFPPHFFSQKKIATCAVVGNSWILANSSMGTKTKLN